MKFKFLTFILFMQSLSFSQNQTYTLDECIKTGLQNNKGLSSAAKRLENANAKYSEAKTSQLPQVKFLGSYSRLSDIPPFEVTIPPPISRTMSISPVLLNSYNMKLSIQQPVFTGSKIESARDMAEYNASSVSEDYSQTKSELIFNIKSIYWNLIKAKLLSGLMNENIVQMQSHLTDITNNFNQGIAAKNDVLKVEVQLSNINILKSDAENTIKILKLNLCNLMGIGLSTEIDVPAFQNISDTKIENLDYYLKSALTQRNDIRSFEYKVKMTESGVTQAQSNWFPQVFLAANYLYANPNPRILPAEDKFKDTWDIGVSLSFDVWNWGANSAKVDQAKAQLSEVQNTFTQIKDGLILEVNQNYLNVLQGNEKINYSKKALEQGEENYRISKEKFEKGTLSNSDLLDAEVLLLQVKTNYTQSLIDYQIAIARLNKSCGIN